MFSGQKDASSEKPLETIHIEKGDLVISPAADENGAFEPEPDWSPEEEKALV